MCIIKTAVHRMLLIPAQRLLHNKYELYSSVLFFTLSFRIGRLLLYGKRLIF